MRPTACYNTVIRQCTKTYDVKFNELKWYADKTAGNKKSSREKGSVNILHRFYMTAVNINEWLLSLPMLQVTIQRPTNLFYGLQRGASPQAGHVHSTFTRRHSWDSYRCSEFSQTWSLPVTYIDSKLKDADLLEFAYRLRWLLIVWKSNVRLIPVKMNQNTSFQKKN